MIFVPAPAFPITYLTLCFRGGALLDPPGREGLSAVCQRLVMGGTRRLGRDAFNAAVEGLGADVSLVTQPHYTAVTSPVLTRALPALLDLLGEALTAPALDPEEVARVARTYAAELEATWDDDGYLAWLWLSRRLFADHPLWRKVSVTPAGVRALGAEEAAARWGSLYCREALRPCLSGDLAREEAEGLLARLRASLPAAPAEARALLGAPVSAQMPPLAPLRGARLTLVRKAQRRQAQLLIAQPAPPADHDDAWALRVGVAALGGTFSSPLMQEVRVKRGLSYGASAVLREEGACGTVTLSATPEGADAGETLEVMLDVLRRGCEGALTEEEVDHARRYLINAHPFRVETPAMRASLMLRAALQGTPLERELEAPRFVAAVTAAQANAALRAHLSAERVEVLALSDPAHLAALAARVGGRFGEVAWLDAADAPEAARG
ncbi:MAG: insulinase family protein [Deltaproteobacteria bacterium]|nr:insulinase family protein [Deltaproteobacteria bacterium]